MPTLDYEPPEPPEPPKQKWDRKFSAWLAFFLSLYCFFAATGDEPRLLWLTFGAILLGLSLAGMFGRLPTRKKG